MFDVNEFSLRKNFSPFKAGLTKDPTPENLHFTCRIAIARIIACLLTKEPASDLSDSYDPIINFEVDISPAEEQGLVVGYQDNEINQNYFYCLSEILKECGIASQIIDTPEEWKASHHRENNSQSIDTVYLSDDKNKALIIPHQHVAKFLYQVCNIWKYHHHPYFCELYGVMPSKFEPIMSYGLARVGQDKINKLNELFRKFHGFLGSFAKFHVDNLPKAYQFLNRHIQAMQLSGLPATHQESNQNEETQYHNQMEVASGKVADVVKLISDHVKQNPKDRIGIINPENSKIIGGHSLIAASIAVEEILCRMSNYIAKLSEKLPPNHPYKFVIDILINLKATGEEITCDISNGVYFLRNSSTREFITREDIPAYINFANQVFSFVKDNPEIQHFLGEKKPHMVENISIQLATGEIHHNAVFISFAGIDGRLSSPEREEYFNQKSTNLFKEDQPQLDVHRATQYYYDMWKAVFQQIAECNPLLDTVFLNPVGTGAFDPSGELTKASAKGFVKAAREFLNNNLENRTRLILSLFNDVVAGTYKDALIDLEDIDELPVISESEEDRNDRCMIQ